MWRSPDIRWSSLISRSESFLDALTTAVAHAVCAPPPFNTAGALKTLAVMDVVYQVIGAEHPPSPGLKRKSPVFGAIDVLIATTYFRRIRNSERAVALLRRDTNALLCERLAVGALLLAIKVSRSGTSPRPELTTHHASPPGAP